MALTERLDIIINASGTKAMREFSAVGKAASSELKQVDTQTAGLTSSLSKAGTMAKVGLAAGLTAGAGALTAFAASAVDAASALGEQQAATNVIFKGGADLVLDYAKTTANALGISERAALEASNKFGDLFLNVGFTQDEAAHLSTALVNLAGDLASFKNKTTEDVLGKLSSGLVGETEGLRELGVVINEAAVKSKAMELGLGGSNRELTEGEKIAARYALIIEKTKNAQGDAARTADSFANKQRQIAAEAENTRAALGSKLTPAVVELQKGAQDTLSSIDKLLGGAGGGGGLAALVKGSLTGPASGFGVLNHAMGLFKTEGDRAATTADLLARAEVDLGLATGRLAEVTKDEGKAREIAAAAMEEHAKQVDRMNSAVLAAIGSEYGYERALNSLEDAQAEVIEKQKDLTAAVTAHGKNSDEARWSAEALSRAQLGLREAVKASAESFAEIAQNNAIANKGQWDSVISARAQITGLERMKQLYPELTAEIDAYIERLRAVAGYENRPITGKVIPADKSGHRPRLTANGGLFNGAQWRIIGEDGPEAVIPLSPSRRNRAEQLMGQAGLSSGVYAAAVGGGNTITINMPPGSDGADVVNAIQRYERRNGKGWRNN